VSAQPYDGAAEIPAVLERQLSSPVRWADCVRRLSELGCDRFVEVGPKRALTRMMRELAPGAAAHAVSDPAAVGALQLTRSLLLAVSPRFIRHPSGGRYLDNQKISFDDFKNIIVERLGCEPEQVTMDASFQEDLNADSLDLVELIYAFEENTGLEIPDEDAERITTVGQAWEYIQEKAGS